MLKIIQHAKVSKMSGSRFRLAPAGSETSRSRRVAVSGLVYLNGTERLVYIPGSGTYVCFVH